MSDDNMSLGRFGGRYSCSRGVPQIEVSFDIDASGLFNVSARLGTGKKQSIRIVSSWIGEGAIDT